MIVLHHQLMIVLYHQLMITHHRKLSLYRLYQPPRLIHQISKIQYTTQHNTSHHVQCERCICMSWMHVLTHAIIHTVIVTDRRSPVRVKKIRAAARYNRGADACHVTRLMCDSIHNTHNTPRTSLNTHITSCKCIDTNTCSMYPTHTYTSPHRTTSPSHGIPFRIGFCLIMVTSCSGLSLRVCSVSGSVSSWFCLFDGGCYLILSFCWIFPSFSCLFVFLFPTCLILSSLLVLSHFELLCCWACVCCFYSRVSLSVPLLFFSLFFSCFFCCPWGASRWRAESETVARQTSTERCVRRMMDVTRGLSTCCFTLPLLSLVSPSTSLNTSRVFPNLFLFLLLVFCYAVHAAYSLSYLRDAIPSVVSLPLPFPFLSPR